MRKDQVALSYHQGMRGLPMVNVKDRGYWRDRQHWQGDHEYLTDGMTPE